MKIVYATIFSFFLFFGSYAQIDSAIAPVDSFFMTAADSAKLLSFDSIVQLQLFEIPFSETAIEELPVVNKIITQQTHNTFKQSIFLVLLNFFCIWVLLLNFSRNRVQKVMATLFNINMLKQFAQVEAKRNNSYLWAYFLLSNLLITILIFVLAFVFKKEVDIFYTFLGVFTFLTLDLIFNALFAYVLNQKEQLDILNFNNAGFLIMSIPFFIVSLLLITYLPESHSLIYGNVFICLSILIYSWKEIRFLFILKANKIKIFSFYFFLYLCTFKLLPLVILFKIIVESIIQ